MNGIDTLIDTNIVIYATKGQEKYVSALQQLGRIGVSAISYMEALLGAKDAREERTLITLLFGIDIIPLDASIAFDALQSLRKRRQKNLRSPLFPDTVIAYTALSLGVPLVTNNPKDFAMFKGLKLVAP